MLGHDFVCLSSADHGNKHYYPLRQIRVIITHPYIGVLGIKLTSPNSPIPTTSVMLNAGNGFNTPNLNDMVLLSNAFYEEGVDGNWTLEVVDVDAVVDNGVLNSWSIRIYGH